MRTLDDIQRAISALSPEDLKRFRAWFIDFDDRAWDRRIAADVAAGRLDGLAEEALADLRAGRTHPL